MKIFWQVMRKLLSPLSWPIDTTNNYCSIFINYTDLCAIIWPFYVFYCWLFSVVYHFFKPLVFMKHSDNYKAVVITCRKFIVFFISLNDINISVMTFQSNIFTQSLFLFFSRFVFCHFQNLQKAIFSSQANTPFLLIPSNSKDKGIFRKRYLFTQKREHF